MPKNHGFFINAVLNYCLIFLLGIASFGGHSITRVGTHGDQSVQSGDQSFLPVLHFSDSSVYIFSQPFISDLIPEQLELCDELGPNDDSTDIEWSKVCQDPSCEKQLHLIAQKNLFAHLTESIQNRSTPYLFILHHSWKSFLI